jgi:hypothetical protein
MDGLHISPFQELLQAAYRQFLEESKRHRASDTAFSRWLGIGQGALSNYINGTRTPDYANTVILSRKLGRDVFKILGYPEVEEVNDPALKFIVHNWRWVPVDTQQQIYEHVQEVVNVKRK